MSTRTTYGTWAIECYIRELDGKCRYHHRLIHDGQTVIDPVPDPGELLNLFALGLIAAGFADLAQSYHDRTLYEDEAELDTLGPACCALSASEVLSYCRGDLATSLMPDAVSAYLGLAAGATYAQGVEQFYHGYQQHATLRRHCSMPTPAEGEADRRETGTHVDHESLHELQQIDGQSSPNQEAH